MPSKGPNPSPPISNKGNATRPVSGGVIGSDKVGKNRDQIFVRAFSTRIAVPLYFYFR